MILQRPHYGFVIPGPSEARSPESIFAVVMDSDSPPGGDPE